MKRKHTFIAFLFSFCFLCVVYIVVSRACSVRIPLVPHKDTKIACFSRAFAPVAIWPVIYKHLRIVAENSTPENMSMVQAYNVNTNKLIWSKKVYEVGIDPSIEEDAQLVFIKSMKIENDKIIIINEKSMSYTLDPNTGEVINNK